MVRQIVTVRGEQQRGLAQWSEEFPGPRHSPPESDLEPWQGFGRGIQSDWLIQLCSIANRRMGNGSAAGAMNRDGDRIGFLPRDWAFPWPIG